MKKAALILCCMALLILPAGAWAYQDEIELGLESGRGLYEEPGFSADVATSAYMLGYTRYFKAVETNDAPYGERAFLQHPSFLGTYFRGGELEYSGAKAEYGSTNIGLGGRYYLPSNTGLGLKIVAEETWRRNGISVSNDEIDGNTTTIGVDQYVTENVNIAARYEILSQDNTDDNIQICGKVIELEARALINNKFAIGAMIGSGSQEVKNAGWKADLDVARFGLDLGFYPSQQLGIFLRTSSQVADMSGYEQTNTASSLSGDYYFNEQSHLELASCFSKEETDDAGTVSEINMSTLSLLFGYLF